MSFGSKLKEARKNCGYTQDNLAKAIGIAKSTITGYEKGSREPDVAKIKAIADTLNISADFLLETKKTPPENPGGGLHDGLSAMIDSLSEDDAQKILDVLQFLLWKREQKQQQI